MTVPEYDLVVIGSGPAGQKGAIAAAKARKRVAIIDRAGMIGGVSVHTGTIPSKTIRERSCGHAAHGQTMETQIRGIVTNAQQATANVNHASAQADTLISDIESRHLPQRVDHIVDSVNDTTSQINQSAIKVHQSLTKALG